MEGALGKEKKTPVYVPDFKKAFEHFCIHAVSLICTFDLTSSFFRVGGQLWMEWKKI